MGEQWDAYLADHTKTDRILERNQPIPQGLYHLVVETIVINEQDELLFVKRHPNKREYPNYYEAGAGGSALRGETSRQAAVRELLEETGIIVEQSALQLLEQWRNDEWGAIYDIYLVRALGQINVILQQEEAVDYRWVSLNEVETFFQQELFVPPQQQLIRDYISAKKTPVF